MKKTFMMAFVLVAVVGLVFAGSVFAQSDSPPIEGERGDGVLREYIVEAMADALGISVDELEAMRENKELRGFFEEQGFSRAEMQTMLQEARTAALNAALADGVITEAQAEQIKNKSGRGGRDRGQGTQNSMGALYNYIAPAIADALGMTVEELEAMRENKELRGFVEEQGFSRAEMQTMMQDARTAALGAALAEGAITQEQFENMQARGGRRGGHGGGSR